MNYLAHIFLSFDDDDITIGNFIADAVKGNKFKDFPDGIKKGIMIHREIDSYTDQHEIVKKGKRRLGEYRHYSGVIMDVYYDHFLAKNWEDYSELPLKNYTQKKYRLLDSHQDILPNKMQYLLGYMSTGDWLFNYQFIEGVDFALSGMARRTAFKSGMERATGNLKLDYELYENEFRVFFKQITDHIHNFTNQLK